MCQSPRRRRVRRPRNQGPEQGTGARFALERVRAAAVGERLSLGGSRCREHLLPLLGSLLECLKFAAEVLKVLGAHDFSRTVRVGNLECDEYGVELPGRLLDRYGLGARGTWYVKLSLQPQELGDTVLLVSLHALERPLERKGGRLRPTW